MVEISNARYEMFVRAETTLDMIDKMVKALPSYKVAEEIKVLLGDYESEVKADAE